MDREDYERRRRALEEICRTDLDLVRAAHEARLRSLEALWLAHSPEPASDTLPAPPALPAPAPVPERRTRKPDVRTSIEEIFSQLPAVFEKKDIFAALGWIPSRGALYRVLLDLAIEGRIHIDPSGGRHPSQYRKLSAQGRA